MTVSDSTCLIDILKRPYIYHFEENLGVMIRLLQPKVSIEAWQKCLPWKHHEDLLHEYVFPGRIELGDEHTAEVISDIAFHFSNPELD